MEASTPLNVNRGSLDDLDMNSFHDIGAQKDRPIINISTSDLIDRFESSVKADPAPPPKPFSRDHVDALSKLAADHLIPQDVREKVQPSWYNVFADQHPVFSHYTASSIHTLFQEKLKHFFIEEGLTTFTDLGEDNTESVNRVFSLTMDNKGYSMLVSNFEHLSSEGEISNFRLLKTDGGSENIGTWKKELKEMHSVIVVNVESSPEVLPLNSKGLSDLLIQGRKPLDLIPALSIVEKK